MASSRIQWLFLFMCILVCGVNASPFYPISEKKTCIHKYVHKLLAADCHGINLFNVPQDRNTGIKVLDLSFNRIRVLHNTDFERYPSVQILYLGENLISHIENYTFSSLQYLEVLNMSWNAIHIIPQDIFHLGYLRKLTVDFNTLHRDAIKEIQNSPIIPSLKYLSMSNCMLQEFPPLVKFPYIEFLNVSGNNLPEITAQQIASACLLKVIDVRDNNNLLSMSSCTCAGLKSWSIYRDIEVQPSLQHMCAPVEEGQRYDCTNQSLRDSDYLYSTCQVNYNTVQRKETWTRIGIIIAICFACILVAVTSIIAYCRICRKSSNTMGKPKTRNENNDQPGDDKDLLAFSNNTDSLHCSS